MAEVAQDTKLQTTIDHYLDYLIRTWESVPIDAREWDDWDDLSQLTYDLDWGVPNDRLAQLRQFAEQGVLTSAQRARYEDLLKLVDRYRPVLAEMLEDKTA